MLERIILISLCAALCAASAGDTIHFCGIVRTGPPVGVCDDGSVPCSATAPCFDAPHSIAFHPYASSFYLSEQGAHRIRQFSIFTGLPSVSTLVGGKREGVPGMTGTQTGHFSATYLNTPEGLLFAHIPPSFILFVADTLNFRILELTLTTLTSYIYVGLNVAGNDVNIYRWDARISAPACPTVWQRRFFFGDASQLKRIAIISNVVTVMSSSFSGKVRAFAVVRFGVGYAADDSGFCLRSVNLGSGVVTAWLGTCGSPGDAIGLTPTFSQISCIVPDCNRKSILVCDQTNNKIKTYMFPSRTVETPSSSLFSIPTSTVSPPNSTYIFTVSSGDSVIKQTELATISSSQALCDMSKTPTVEGKITPTESISNGTFQFCGMYPTCGLDVEHGTCATSCLFSPIDVAVGYDGTVYMLESKGKFRVRRAHPSTDIVDTIVGRIDAVFNTPKYIEHFQSFLYVSDTGAHRVVKINLYTHAIRDFCGTLGIAGDISNVIALGGLLREPHQAIWWRGRFYLADALNKKVKRVAGLTNVVMSFFQGHQVVMGLAMFRSVMYISLPTCVVQVNTTSGWKAFVGNCSSGTHMSRFEWVSSLTVDCVRNMMYISDNVRHHITSYSFADRSTQIMCGAPDEDRAYNGPRQNTCQAFHLSGPWSSVMDNADHLLMVSTAFGIVVKTRLVDYGGVRASLVGCDYTTTQTVGGGVASSTPTTTQTNTHRTRTLANKQMTMSKTLESTLGDDQLTFSDSREESDTDEGGDATDNTFTHELQTRAIGTVTPTEKEFRTPSASQTLSDSVLLMTRGMTPSLSVKDGQRTATQSLTFTNIKTKDARDTPEQESTELMVLTETTDNVPTATVSQRHSIDNATASLTRESHTPTETNPILFSFLPESAQCEGSAIQREKDGCRVVIALPGLGKWRWRKDLSYVPTTGSPRLRHTHQISPSGLLLHFHFLDTSYVSSSTVTFLFPLEMYTFTPVSPKKQFFRLVVTPVEQLTASPESIAIAVFFFAAMAAAPRSSAVLHAGKTSLLSSMPISCDSLEEIRLDFTQHPTQTSIDNMPWNTRVFAGALTYNTVIWVVCAAFHILVVFVPYAHDDGWEGHYNPLSRYMQMFWYPSLSAFPFLFLYQVMVSGAVFVARTETSAGFACAVYIGMGLGGTVALIRFLLPSRCHWEFRQPLNAAEIKVILIKCVALIDQFAPEKIFNVPNALETAYKGREADLLRDLTIKYDPPVVVKVRFVLPEWFLCVMASDGGGKWTNKNNGFLQQYGLLFREYMGGKEWFAIVDIALVTLLGICGGLNVGCMPNAIIVFLLFLTNVSLLIAFRPYSNILTSAVMTFCAVLQLIAAACRIAAVNGGGPDLIHKGVIPMVMINAILLFLKVCADIVWAFFGPSPDDNSEKEVSINVEPDESVYSEAETPFLDEEALELRAFLDQQDSRKFVIPSVPPPFAPLFHRPEVVNGPITILPSSLRENPNSKLKDVVPHLFFFRSREDGSERPEPDEYDQWETRKKLGRPPPRNPFAIPLPPMLRSPFDATKL